MRNVKLFFSKIKVAYTLFKPSTKKAVLCCLELNKEYNLVAKYIILNMYLEDAMNLVDDVANDIDEMDAEEQSEIFARDVKNHIGLN